MTFRTSSDRDLARQMAHGALAGLNLDDSFNFVCRDECMGTCCNRIDISLDPWDVEVMARHLGISGQQFVNLYCTCTWDKNMCWPVITLRHAAKGPCAFLLAGGKCSIYPARSRNCRTYPVGRAVRFETVNGEKKIVEQFFLVDQQKPCRGCHEGSSRMVRDWLEEAGSFEYFAFSDLYLSLIDYAHRELAAPRWLSEAAGHVLLPFLFAPDLLRTRLSITLEAAGHEEFYRRRVQALYTLLTDMAAELGHAPRTADNKPGTTLMERVQEILAYGTS